MNRYSRWIVVGIAAAAAIVMTRRWTGRVARTLDRGLDHAERVTSDSRQAVEKTAEALAHAEEAVHSARVSVFGSREGGRAS
jgi:hypothetical protein